jgi:hypothetical protein
MMRKGELSWLLQILLWAIVIALVAAILYKYFIVPGTTVSVPTPEVPLP